MKDIKTRKAFTKYLNPQSEYERYAVGVMLGPPKLSVERQRMVTEAVLMFVNHHVVGVSDVAVRNIYEDLGISAETESRINETIHEYGAKRRVEDPKLLRLAALIMYSAIESAETNNRRALRDVLEVIDDYGCLAIDESEERECYQAAADLYKRFVKSMLSAEADIQSFSGPQNVLAGMTNKSFKDDACSNVRAFRPDLEFKKILVQNRGRKKNALEKWKDGLTFTQIKNIYVGMFLMIRDTHWLTGTDGFFLLLSFIFKKIGIPYFPEVESESDTTFYEPDSTFIAADGKVYNAMQVMTSVCGIHMHMPLMYPSDVLEVLTERFGMQRREARDYLIVSAAVRFLKNSVDYELDGLIEEDSDDGLTETLYRELEESKKQIGKLMQEIEYLKKENHAKDKEIKAAHHETAEKQREIDELQELLAVMANCADDTRGECDKDAANEGAVPETVGASAPLTPQDIVDSGIDQSRILIWGGKDSYFPPLMKKYFPDANYMSSEMSRNDMSVLDRVDYVFINPTRCRHGSYWAIMNRARTNGKRIWHFRVNNIDRCAREVVDFCRKKQA